jgi:hypothetical protein
MINVDSSTSTLIANNTLTGGMSGGIVIHNTHGTENCVRTLVIGNGVSGCGNAGITVQTNTGSTSTTDTTIINGNTVVDCGAGTTANPANTNNGIWVVGAYSNNTFIDGNFCRDDGAATQQWGIYVDATVPAGTTTIGDNVCQGNTSGTIFGAGWLAYTPTVTAATGTLTSASGTGRYRVIGKTVHFQLAATITTNGTGAGSINATLPVANTASAIGIAAGREDGVTGKALQGKIPASSSVMSTFLYDGTYPGANGAVCIVSGIYEMA